jgi:predicted MFS family arabinose efflux permease
MQRPSEATRVVLCLFSVLFLGVADNQIVSPLLPAIRAAFGRTAAEAGLLFTAYSMAAGLSVLVWGPASDAFGARRGLLAGLAAFAAGSAVSFVSGSFTSLVVGRILTGVAASLLSLNTITFAGNYFPYRTRGWAMGSIFSSYFAALILGVPLASLAAARLGWKAVFGITGAAALVLLPLSARLLPPLQAAPATSGSRVARHARNYLEFLSRRSTFGALVGSFTASAGMMGFLAYVGVWLHDDFGASTQKVALVFLVSGAAALIASPFAGALSDRMGKRRQFMLSNVALALLLVLLPRASWGAALFALFCAISLSAAFRQGPMEALITEVVPAGQRGSFVALKNSFSQLGIALAAFASGQLFERGGYVAVCLLGAALNTLSAAAVLFLVRDKHL